MWIRTLPEVVDVVVTSDSDAVAAAVWQRGATEFDLTLYPQTDRAPGSYRATLRLVARTADGQSRFGSLLPAGFDLRELD